jgi:uroporphyrinogen decarboxylase
MALMDDIRRCTELQSPADLPIFALSQEFDAKYCGMKYAEYISTPDNIVRCQLEVIDKFGWDWSWLHIDDTLEFEALGVGVAGGENIVPATADYLDFDRQTLAGLEVPNPQTSARMPLLLDAIAGIREARGDKTCVTGRVCAPFSTVGLTFGLQEAMYKLMDDPDLVRDAIAFGEECAISWGLAQIDAGAHAIWYGDCNASTHMISPAQFEEWALEPCKRVCQVLKDAGAFVFLHNSEEQIAGLRLQALTEPSVLSVGPGLDMAVAHRELGGEIPLMGNLDPIGMLTNASASQVAGETDRLVRLMSDGGMILNSGECIPREAKAPNMHTMIDTGRKVWGLVQGRR